MCRALHRLEERQGGGRVPAGHSEAWSLCHRALGHVGVGFGAGNRRGQPDKDP